MAQRRYFIHSSFSDAESPVTLRVTSPDVPASTLLRCVQDSLGVPPEVRLYFTYEPQGDSVVPLSASLPDGVSLRAHVAGQAPQDADPEFSELESEPFLTGVTESTHPTRCARCGAYARYWCSSGPTRDQTKESLANESTDMAWERTGLAAMRTSLAYLKAESFSAFKDLPISGDVLAAVFGFLPPLLCLVGRQRFMTVRDIESHPGYRRIAASPLVCALGVGSLLAAWATFLVLGDQAETLAFVAVLKSIVAS